MYVHLLFPTRTTMVRDGKFTFFILLFFGMIYLFIGSLGSKNHEHIVFTKRNGALGTSYVSYPYLVKMVWKPCVMVRPPSSFEHENITVFSIEIRNVR